MLCSVIQIKQGVSHKQTSHRVTLWPLLTTSKRRQAETHPLTYVVPSVSFVGPPPNPQFGTTGVFSRPPLRSSEETGTISRQNFDKTGKKIFQRRSTVLRLARAGTHMHAHTKFAVLSNCPWTIRYEGDTRQ